MNDRNTEWQAQERARTLSGSTASGDATVDRYRAVYQGLAMAPFPAPPTDLGAQILEGVRRAEADERFERWTLRLLGLAGGVGIAFYAGPTLLDVLAPAWSGGALPEGITKLAANPWLWSTLAALATALMLDRRPRGQVA